MGSRQNIRNRKYEYIIALVHLFAMLTAIPYFLSLEYKVTTDGYGKCSETMSQNKRKVYTIVLFILQYVGPLLVMIIFYSLTWYKVYLSNKSMITMSEDYEQKMDWAARYGRKTSTVSSMSTVTRISRICITSVTRKLSELSSSAFFVV